MVRYPAVRTYEVMNGEIVKYWYIRWFQSLLFLWKNCSSGYMKKSTALYAPPVVNFAPLSDSAIIIYPTERRIERNPFTILLISFISC